MNDLTNEERLLLWVAGNEPADDAAGFVRDRFAWDDFLRIVTVHQLGPRAFQRLKSFVPTVPPRAVEALRRQYLATTARNLRFAAWSKTVISRLYDAGVAVMPLKGVHFSELVQGDIGLRPTTDLDLLVREEDLDRVGRALETFGYRPFDRGYSPEFGQQARHRSWSTLEAGFRGVIEIHWNFYVGQPHKIDMAPFWQRAQRRRFDGADIFSLAPADLVLFLAIQQRLHSYQSLKLYVDLNDVLVRFPEVEWREVVERARESRQRVGLYFCLRFARLLLRAPVPDTALDRLRPSFARRWPVERLVNRRGILRPRRDGPVNIFRDAIRLLTDDSVRDQVRVVGRLGTTYGPDLALRYGIATDGPGRFFKIAKTVVDGVRSGIEYRSQPTGRTRVEQGKRRDGRVKSIM